MMPTSNIPVAQLTQEERSAMRDPSLNHFRLFLMLPCAVLFSLCSVVDHLEIHQDNTSRWTTTSHAARKLQGTSAPSVDADVVIDVISVGSLLRPRHQEAQERTFGSATAIRNFVRITEQNDTDASCFSDLTGDQLNQVVNFCAKTEHQSYISQTLRDRLFKPKKHIGWMCAQKRPLDGMYHVLQRYARKEEAIPDFLFIIDDDTFINMDRLVPDLIQNYPVDQPHAVAGCNFDFLRDSGITFPYGGFGSYLTRAAIERLLQPFYCDGRDEHSNLACWRLNFNALGEKEFYVEGMSVIDFMHAYSSQLQFTEVETWKKTGYCLHSDHALAYFINFYHITVPEGTVDRLERPNDRVRRKYSFVGLVGERECEHIRGSCSPDKRICHYISPKQMGELYAQQRNSSSLV